MKPDLQETLQLILTKLTSIEKALDRSTSPPPRTSTEAVLREKLDRLTIKRHAVLTASLAGVSYQELSQLMQCDQTTVKLHLRAALQLLGIPTRSILLASHKTILDSIPDKEYKSRYGISKRWWLEQDVQLMDVLQTTKAAANQHTKTS